MTEIYRRKKALSVSPLKTSQTTGAALAFLGISRAMPLMHGSQGCTAFAKVFFVRHFREPVPLQTTAMDQVSSIMGADENITEALRVISEKNSPSIIGLVTTGLAETQGADINRAVYDFRQKYPEYENVAVVAVNTPDFAGSFESGYATEVKGIINTLVPKTIEEITDASGEAKKVNKVGLRKKQVNVLCGANLTPGDLEFVSESIESFGLRPLLIPDLSGSLDGHLDDGQYNALTTGGVSVDDIKTAGESIATLAIGESMASSAKLIEKKTAVPSFCFGHLLGLDECDAWFSRIAELSGAPVPMRWQKQRRQLQDAMLDTHFMLGQTRVAIASDPDMLAGFHRLVNGMGADTIAAVSPAKGPALDTLGETSVQIGDLEDMEKLARENHVQLVLANSHGVDSAERLGVPILRIGFPQYDLVGGFQRCWFGYRGTSQALFDLANLSMSHHVETQPYYSKYAQKREDKYLEVVADGWS